MTAVPPVRPPEFANDAEFLTYITESASINAKNHNTYEAMLRPDIIEYLHSLIYTNPIELDTSSGEKLYHYIWSKDIYDSKVDKVLKLFWLKQAAGAGGKTDRIKPDNMGLDELVLHDVMVHIERMSPENVWLGFYRKDGSQLTMFMNVIDGKIMVVAIDNEGFSVLPNGPHDFSEESTPETVGA